MDWQDDIDKVKEVEKKAEGWFSSHPTWTVLIVVGLCIIVLFRCVA